MAWRGGWGGGIREGACGRREGVTPVCLVCYALLDALRPSPNPFDVNIERE